MNKIPFILLSSFLSLNISNLLAREVEVLRVINLTSNTPTYIKMDDSPSIKNSNGEVVISTFKESIHFDFNANPSISFVKIDESHISRLIEITEDKIVSDEDIKIYNINGIQVPKENLPQGTYIIKTPSQSFKINLQ